ncbi:MAG: hypothetical protein R3263_00110 [Myxococcota bacterium]|nr:hypothetical protein [Myxococcota bacterium]
MSPFWIVFGAYLIGVLALSEAAARLRVGSLDEYLLSGRRQGTLATAATLTATVIGAGSTLGAAGVAYFVGLSAGWYLLSAAPGLVLLAFTFAPAARALTVYSVPGYLERRYGRTAAALAAVLGLVALALFVSAQLYALASVLHELGQVSRGRALVLCAAAVVVYTWRGGNWAIHWSDGLQLAWLYVGLVAAAVLAVDAAGGLGALADPPVAAGYEEAGARWFHPETRRPVGGFDPLALGDTVAAWIVMSTSWHFAMQSTAQRLLAARDARVARRACLLAAAAIVPLAALVALSGMAARILDPDLGLTAGMEQVSALPVLVREVLDPLVGGVVVAALVAILMSTCDSALLGAATLLLKDLLPRLRRGRDAGRSPAERCEARADREIRSSRRVVLAVGAAAFAGAWVAPGLVRTLEMVAAVYGVALFGPLLLGPFWRRASEAGALAAMLTAGSASLAWRGLGLEDATGLHMLNVGLPLSFGALAAGSLWRPDDAAEV